MGQRLQRRLQSNDRHSKQEKSSKAYEEQNHHFWQQAVGFR
ncbi:hypothetical protein SynA1825c_01656 [Synechococcus sp. A18-25c]|nr:hypothetical protein SynA1560_01675 [Synechococcus sp. A15-60]QNJ19960.1 hypothetical protein SynA1825c_01656 [Synechococcus sp. A18-25c]